MLHEQMTIQVLDLMAEAPGRQALVFDLEPLTVPVLGTDTHHLRPRYHAVFPGNAQAALQPGLFSLGVDDLRVHQLDQLILLVQHHAHPAQYAHLGRSQAHAAGVGQCICQVVQQRMQPAVKICNRAAHLAQARLALQRDLS